MKQETLEQTYERSHREEFREAVVLRGYERASYLSDKILECGGKVMRIFTPIIRKIDNFSQKQKDNLSEHVYSLYIELSSYCKDFELVVGEPHPDFARSDRMVETMLELLDDDAENLGGEI